MGLVGVGGGKWGWWNNEIPLDIKQISTFKKFNKTFKEYLITLIFIKETETLQHKNGRKTNKLFFEIFEILGFLPIFYKLWRKLWQKNFWPKNRKL